jgi:hypothetical protein
LTPVFMSALRPRDGLGTGGGFTYVLQDLAGGDP